MPIEQGDLKNGIILIPITFNLLQDSDLLLELLGDGRRTFCETSKFKASRKLFSGELASLKIA